MNKLWTSSCSLFAVLALSFTCGIQVFAQNAPIPGSSESTQSAPPPGPVAHPNSANGATTSGYRQLPLSAGDAQTRLQELKVLLTQSRPQAIQDAVYQLCEWLADMTDAHNKLATTFSKNDATKGQADAEKQAAVKFYRLKNQAQLLKADLLIKQCRFPEALGPLVDIVVAEPKSSTGQAAYKRLQEIGFAEEVEPKSEPKATNNSNPVEKETKSASPVSKVTKPLTPAAPHIEIAHKEKKSTVVNTTQTAPVPQAPTWMTGTPYGSGNKSDKDAPAAN